MLSEGVFLLLCALLAEPAASAVAVHPRPALDFVCLPTDGGRECAFYLLLPDAVSVLRGGASSPIETPLPGRPSPYARARAGWGRMMLVDLNRDRRPEIACGTGRHSHGFLLDPTPDGVEILTEFRRVPLASRPNELLVGLFVPEGTIFEGEESRFVRGGAGLLLEEPAALPERFLSVVLTPGGRFATGTAGDLSYARDASRENPVALSERGFVYPLFPSSGEGVITARTNAEGWELCEIEVAGPRRRPRLAVSWRRPGTGDFVAARLAKIDGRERLYLCTIENGKSVIREIARR